MQILGYFLAILIGLSIGLIGAGGSILTVPVLNYIFQMPVSEAMPASLLIVGMTSLLALIEHWKKGNVNLKPTLSFLLFSSLGAWIGAKAIIFFAPKLRLIIFIILMLIAGVVMLLRKESSVKLPAKQNIYLIALVGTFIGFLTGLVGIGGGFMIVPALTLLLAFPIEQAIGSSLFIIATNAFIGLSASHLKIDLPKAFYFFLCTALGTLLAKTLSPKINAQGLKKGFAIMVICLAVFMFIKEF
jgi:uncharacterized membrane protein YfcA